MSLRFLEMILLQSTLPPHYWNLMVTISLQQIERVLLYFREVIHYKINLTLILNLLMLLGLVHNRKILLFLLLIKRFMWLQMMSELVEFRLVLKHLWWKIINHYRYLRAVRGGIIHLTEMEYIIIVLLVMIHLVEMEYIQIAPLVTLHLMGLAHHILIALD